MAVGEPIKRFCKGPCPGTALPDGRWLTYAVIIQVGAAKWDISIGKAEIVRRKA